MNKIISSSLFNKMIKDRLVRISIIKDSFLYFFHFYHAHYVKYETADFQKEIMSYLERSSTENFYICAFRNSGKSTIITTAYPLWAILGKQQKKFCVIFCQTQAQAKQHMMNIRNELENNELLKKDLGPFQEEGDEWGSHSLVFKKHEARITIASTEQSIRGIRHNEYRPDLFICDDIEDLSSVRTKEGRDKNYRWLKGEVVPAGDKNTRLIIVGNFLHEDSLLMRIKEEINQGKAKGIFKEYPLLDADENYESCLWPGKFKNAEDIKELKMSVVDEAAWQREYLLRIISGDEQVIHQEWIHYYDQLPGVNHVAYRGIYAGVDLAISLKEKADFTSIVWAHIYGRKDRLRIYILPNPFNEKLDFPDQIELVKNIKNTQIVGDEDEIFIESNNYQAAFQQMLDVHGIEAKAIRSNDNKRIRLSLTSTHIKSGLVKFPRQGCESLIRQLVGFGSEKHDDLADAFSILVNETLNKHKDEPKRLISFLGDDNGDSYLSDYVDVG